MPGRLIDYMGQGLFAARPLAADMPARIQAGGASIYYAYDTGDFSFFNQNSVAWDSYNVFALGAGFESIQDMIATFLQPGTGITITYDDAGNQLVIAGTVTQYTDAMAVTAVGAIPTTESIQDLVAALLVQGTGMSLTYDDAGNLLTIATTITQYTDAMARTAVGAIPTDESIQDMIGAFLQNGSGITLTYDDAGNHLTIASSITQYTNAMADARIAAASIDKLADVDTTTVAPTSGQALIWSTSLGAWVPGTVASGGGGGGSTLAYVSARYWRIRCLRSVSGHGGDGLGFSQVDWTDGSASLLRGSGYGIASTTDSGNANHVLANAYDGGTGADHGWYSLTTANGQNGQWIGYDFGAAVSPHNVKFAPINGFPWTIGGDLEVEYSSDAVIWYSLCKVIPAAGANGVQQTIALPQVTSSGGSAGGTTAPTVRSSAIQSSSNSNFVIAWPAGTVAGDRAVIFGAHGYNLGCPSGWTQLDNSTGTNTNGIVVTRVLSNADITAGSVTVSAGGGYNGVFGIVTYVGNPSIRLAGSLRNGAGSSPVAFSTDGSPLTTEQVILFGSNRGNSVDTIDIGTALQSVAAVEASGVLKSYVPPAVGGFVANFAYATPGSGNYMAAVAAVAR